MLRWAASLGVLALCACQTVPLSREQTPPAAASAEADRGLHLDAINQLMAEGQLYAALAHLEDERRRVGPNARLLRLEADCRRRLGQQDAAQKLYLGLTSGPEAGPAHHGLGLMYAPKDRRRALGHFAQATRLLPLDADIRSDYGFALLQDGRITDAEMQLSTAVELAPSAKKPRNNLAVLWLFEGKEQQALLLLARDGKADPQLLARLRREAQSLSTRPGPALR